MYTALRAARMGLASNWHPESRHLRGTETVIVHFAVPGVPMKPSDVKHVDGRVVDLEAALARTALAYHLQHMMATGPSWDECGHPLCAEAKRLLPDVRLACRVVTQQI